MYVNCSSQKVKGQGHVTYEQTSYNSAVDGNINFKLGGNYRRGGRRVWYTFQVMDFQKLEILTVGPL